ncbi:hypothetical protein DPMN_084418 [Dreissena polymorpha]|uniref:Uncharacterized protein n=1 Tax=Dreissena polymorpha TaxID=45954 RepID=A0A9D4BC02_DREPO|nr:hypothetical protein DPMN_084418 [Dreissena polymorpha]
MLFDIPFSWYRAKNKQDSGYKSKTILLLRDIKSTRVQHGLGISRRISTCYRVLQKDIINKIHTVKHVSMAYGRVIAVSPLLCCSVKDVDEPLLPMRRVVASVVVVHNGRPFSHGIRDITVTFQLESESEKFSELFYILQTAICNLLTPLVFIHVMKPNDSVLRETCDD